MNIKSVNKVILVGHLGGEPKLHHMRQKRPICTFNIATQGLKVTDTAWHSVVVYGKLAEMCHQELTKGSLVYIEGSIDSREWEDKAKIRHKTYSVYPKVVRLLGGKRVRVENIGSETQKFHEKPNFSDSDEIEDSIHDE